MQAQGLGLGALGNLWVEKFLNIRTHNASDYARNHGTLQSTLPTPIASEPICPQTLNPNPGNFRRKSEQLRSEATVPGTVLIYYCYFGRPGYRLAPEAELPLKALIQDP